MIKGTIHDLYDLPPRQFETNDPFFKIQRRTQRTLLRLSSTLRMDGIDVFITEQGKKRRGSLLGKGLMFAALLNVRDRKGPQCYKMRADFTLKVILSLLRWAKQRKCVFLRNVFTWQSSRERDKRVNSSSNSMIDLFLS